MEPEKHWYGQYLVKVWKIEGSYWALYPWRFSILGPDNKEWQYTGVPNYCKTRASALKRAWYRVKWMREGTIGDHYQ